MSVGVPFAWCVGLMFASCLVLLVLASKNSVFFYMRSVFPSWLRAWCSILLRNGLGACGCEHDAFHRSLGVGLVFASWLGVRFLLGALVVDSWSWLLPFSSSCARCDPVDSLSLE